jgi:hypothetical protein
VREQIPELVRRQRCVGVAGELAVEVRGQERQILGPLAQRGQPYGHHAEPIEEVLAERATIDVEPKVPIGRGQDPGIEGDGLVGAERAHLALLEHARQLRLNIGGQPRDLIEKERPLVGFEEQPAAWRIVGAARVAEQLSLDVGSGDRGAVDHRERSVRARARLVNRLSCQILPGAGLAHQQGRRVALGQCLEEREQPTGSRAPPDQLAEALGVAERQLGARPRRFETNTAEADVEDISRFQVRSGDPVAADERAVGTLEIGDQETGWHDPDGQVVT